MFFWWSNIKEWLDILQLKLTSTSNYKDYRAERNLGQQTRQFSKFVLLP